MEIVSTYSDSNKNINNNETEGFELSNTNIEKELNFTNINPHRISIAPMLDVTNAHFRFLMRLITKHTMLWTEMINERTILNSKNGYNQELFYTKGVENPIVVQLGGSDPDLLGQCAKYCKELGYDEINLNCGCPSSKVLNSNFGACLMSQPKLVYDCCKSMSINSGLPISVKCRLGLEEFDKTFLNNFITIVSEGYNDENSDNNKLNLLEVTNTFNTDTSVMLKEIEILNHINSKSCTEVKYIKKSNNTYLNNEINKYVDHFIMHSRVALMNIDTKKNRTIPPLMYEECTKLKSEYPNLNFSINGGFTTKSQIKDMLVNNENNIIGVMIGRAAYSNPFMFADFDSTFYNKKDMCKNREEIIYEYADYCDKIKSEVIPNIFDQFLVKPLINLFNGERNSHSFKNLLMDFKNKEKDETIGDHLKTVIKRFKKSNPNAVERLTPLN